MPTSFRNFLRTWNVNRIARIVAAPAWLAAALLAACTPTNAPPPPKATNITPAFAQEYRIGVADQLQVSVWHNPDLSVSVPVRPDGRITVPLAGDINVGGETPSAVAESIKKTLATYVRDPQVTVIVVGMNSAEYTTRVRVTGAVRTPRSLPYRQGMTVLDVVLESGGLTEFAAAANTVLYHADGQHQAIKLNAILERGDLSTNFALTPGDVVTVPEQRF